VVESHALPEHEVRSQFDRIRPLRLLKPSERGWTLDDLNAVRRLGKVEFSTAEAYGFSPEMERLYPGNRHVRDKIRQQLQVLRDSGLLIHIERGRWRLP
jgi:type II restriction enzyme